MAFGLSWLKHSHSSPILVHFSAFYFDAVFFSKFLFSCWFRYLSLFSIFKKSQRKERVRKRKLPLMVSIVSSRHFIFFIFIHSLQTVKLKKCILYSFNSSWIMGVVQTHFRVVWHQLREIKRLVGLFRLFPFSNHHLKNRSVIESSFETMISVKKSLSGDVFWSSKWSKLLFWGKNISMRFWLKAI